MESFINDLVSSSILYSLISGLVVAAFGYILAGRSETKTKDRRYCKKDIQEGIKSGMLQWEDLEILAQRWKQNRTDIHWILSDLLHESLTKPGKEGEILYGKIKELVKTEQSTEPFIELPESIRIHIENVSSRFREDGDDVLRPLAAAICDNIVVSSKKAESQRKLTIWSFLVGLISLLIGITGLVFALSSMSPV